MQKLEKQKGTIARVEDTWAIERETSVFKQSDREGQIGVGALIREEEG